MPKFVMLINLSTSGNKVIFLFNVEFEKDVGQKGTQVSGGQKQRLALARCLVRKPVLFLLDESTSAMDTDTEQIVFKNLQPVFKNHTCISIAHRLSTI